MLTRPVLRLTLTAVPAGATQLVPAAGEGTGAAACPPLLSPAAPWPPACAAVRRTATHSVAHVRHKLFSCIRPPRQMDFLPTVATRLMRLGHCLVSAPAGADWRQTFRRYPFGANREIPANPSKSVYLIIN